MKEAKKFLWSLDRDDVYHSEDEESDEEDDRYVQAPNVPRDKVREMLKEFKETYKKATAAEAAPNEQATVDTARSTLSNSVAGTLKVYEEPPVQNETDTKDALLAEKEEENRRLRDEIQECQQQLNSLRDMVKKLVDMDRSRSSEPNKKKKSKKSKTKSSKSKRHLSASFVTLDTTDGAPGLEATETTECSSEELRCSEEEGSKGGYAATWLTPTTSPRKSVEESLSKGTPTVKKIPLLPNLLENDEDEKQASTSDLSAQLVPFLPNMLPSPTTEERKRPDP